MTEWDYQSNLQALQDMIVKLNQGPRDLGLKEGNYRQMLQLQLTIPFYGSYSPTRPTICEGIKLQQLT